MAMQILCDKAKGGCGHSFEKEWSADEPKCPKCGADYRTSLRLVGRSRPKDDFYN